MMMRPQRLVFACRNLKYIALREVPKECRNYWPVPFVVVVVVVVVVPDVSDAVPALAGGAASAGVEAAPVPEAPLLPFVPESGAADGVL